MVSGARALGLPDRRPRPAAETFPRVSLALALVTLMAGPLIAAVQVVFANPVALEVMQSSASNVTGGIASVVTVSSVLPAVTLLGPLLVFAAVAYGVAGTSTIRTQERPALFRLPAAEAFARARAGVRSATVPEQYRSILNLRRLEAATVSGRPVLWLGALAALVFAVTR